MQLCDERTHIRELVNASGERPVEGRMHGRNGGHDTAKVCLDQVLRSNVLHGTATRSYSGIVGAGQCQGVVGGARW